MTHVGSVFHEVRGYMNWNQHGDSPYWAVRKLAQALGGGDSFEITIDGQDVRVSLNNKPSGISPRPDDSVEEIYEYGIWWELENGLRFGGHLKPRFEPKEFRKKQPDVPFYQRDKITVPKNLGEAVSFQVEAGTYRPPSFYEKWLPKVCQAIAKEAGTGWHRDYLAGQLHETSTIHAMEMTLRYHTEESKKLTRMDGTMFRLYHCVAGKRGSKAEFSADDTETEGYLYQLRFDREAASELFPGQRRGFQFKSYHPRNPRNVADDPLSHPRVGALFKKKWNDHRGVRWSEWRDLARELEEDLINILRWGNVPIEPGPTFIPDDYFDVEPSDRDIGFYDDPTPEIERHQDSVVLRVLSRALDSDADILEQLATDGGHAHHSKLEAETGYSESTTYRALQRLEGIIESQNGVFRFISEKVRQDVQAVVDRQRRARDRLERDVVAIAHLLDVDPQRLQEKGSAFQEWLTKYAADFRDGDDDQPHRFKIDAVLDRLRSTSCQHASDVVYEGLRAWKDAGLHPDEFLNAVVQYPTPAGDTEAAVVRSLIR